jgi:hypothetical protein
MQTSASNFLSLAYPTCFSLAHRICALFPLCPLPTSVTTVLLCGQSAQGPLLALTFLFLGISGHINASLLSQHKESLSTLKIAVMEEAEALK